MGGDTRWAPCKRSAGPAVDTALLGLAESPATDGGRWWCRCTRWGLLGSTLGLHFTPVWETGQALSDHAGGQMLPSLQPSGL